MAPELDIKTAAGEVVCAQVAGGRVSQGESIIIKDRLLGARSTLSEKLEWQIK